MKPHEETWDSDGDGTIYAEQRSPADNPRHSRFPWEQQTNFGAFGDMSAAYGKNGTAFAPTAQDQARAQLAAHAPAMARLLLKIMRHVAPGSLAATCGHKEHDEVQAVLRAAGVLP